MVTTWSNKLQELQTKGIITGFVVVTAQVPLQTLGGTFEEECAKGISPAVQQLLKSFYTTSSPPTTYDIWGTKVNVINQTDSHFVAISKQRQLGILAINLPGGVLLASFNRSVQPAAALAAVKDACAAAFAADIGS